VIRALRAAHHAVGAPAATHLGAEGGNRVKFLWRMVDETIVGAVIHVFTCRLTDG
jgi:hypothetical protein